jgi:hypothetical protein
LPEVRLIGGDRVSRVYPKKDGTVVVTFRKLADGTYRDNIVYPSLEDYLAAVRREFHKHEQPPVVTR